jgi:hypothetical protein
MIGSRIPSPRCSFVPEAPWLSGRWLCLIIAASAILDAALLRLASLRIEATPAVLGFSGWAVAAVAACYCLRTPASPWERFTRDLIEGLSLFALISLLGAIASYPLAAGQHALVDPELERIDLTLHFHWLSWYEWVAGRPWLQLPERAAYLSIFATPAVLIGYFAWTGRRAENRLFVVTFWLAVVITLSLFPLLPAAGPFATLWHGSAPYMPVSALYQDQMIMALRHHAVQEIDVGKLHGLVCAPSFHAASAVIYMATAFRLNGLRWPLVTLNATMLLATPIEGTHYLTDLLAGATVGGMALWIAPLLVEWMRTSTSRPFGFSAMSTAAAE